MNFPLLNLRRGRKGKNWFYSLDSASKYFLSTHSSKEPPTIAELRELTGTQRVFHPSETSTPSPPQSQKSSLDSQRPSLASSTASLRRSRDLKRHTISPVPQPQSQSQFTTPLLSPPPRPQSLYIHTPNPPLSPPARTLPAHPTHSRLWTATNLRCNIHTLPCPLCEEPCCAYRAAVMIVEKTPKSRLSYSEGEAAKQTQRHAMKTLANAIRDVVGPADQDEGTFIRCSECGKWVCPNCIGVCPVDGCGDMVCVGCKGGDDVWGVCAWHEGERIDEDNEGKSGSRQDGRGSGNGNDELGGMKRMEIETPFFRRASNERKLIFPGTESRFVPGVGGGEGEWVLVRCREKRVAEERDSEGHLRSCADDTVCGCLSGFGRRSEEGGR